MGHLVNGAVVVAEGIKKRPSENGGEDVSLDVPLLKFKWRKVSANRDFPKGCGRFVKPNGNCVAVDSAEAEGAIAEPDPVKQSESSDEPGTFDRKVQIESPKALISETPKLFEVLDQVKEPETMKILEPVVLDTQLGSPSVAFEPGITDLPKNLNQIEVPESKKDSDRPEQNLSKNASLLEEKELPSSSVLHLPVDSVLPDASVLLKVSDQSQASVPDEAVLGSMHKKYPPRRRISAYRDFPPGCGRNAARVECLNSVDSSEDSSLPNEKSCGENRRGQNATSDAKRMREKVQDRDAAKSKLKGNIMNETGDRVLIKSEGGVKKEMVEHVHVREAFKSKLRQDDSEKTSNKSPRVNIMSPSYVKSQSFSKKVDRGIGSSGGKLGMESVKLSKDMSFKRKFPRMFVDERSSINQSQRKEYVGFEPSNEVVIVQSLMAAPNCPWSQGKQRTFKSASGDQAIAEEWRQGKQRTFKSASGDQTQGEEWKQGKQRTYKSASGDQPHGEEYVSMELFDDRVIVQALMAARNCPWRQGKRFKSPSSLPLVKSKAKRLEFVRG